MSFSIQTLAHNLSFSTSITPPQNLLFPRPTWLSPSIATGKPSPAIRMGGGPRTYPGGVSKWQWKRMQEKKAKQLLKARLCRERQIYEMRKRAELRAAASELERPWEVVERAPTLFSVSADEQLKVLADRFQRPGGFDMWTENDGPELFRTPDELPSARFFPKGVVHSVKPYARVSETEEMEFGGDGSSDLESVDSRNSAGLRRMIGASGSNHSARSDSEENFNELDFEDGDVDELREQSRSSSGSKILNSKKSYGFSKKGSRRKFESSGSNSLGLSDSDRSLYELDGELGEARNRNDKRSYQSKFIGRLVASSEKGGSLNLHSSSDSRFKGNRRNHGSFELNGSEKRNGNNRRGYGRKSEGRCASFREGENENEGLSDSESLNLNNSYKSRLAISGENGVSFKSNSSYGSRVKGNRRSYESSDSNGLEKKFGTGHGVLGHQRNGNNRRGYGRKPGGRFGSFREEENGNEGLLDSKSLNFNTFKQSSTDLRRKVFGRSSASSNSRNGPSSSRPGFDTNQRGMRIPSFRSERRNNRGNDSRTKSNLQSEVYDMSLEQDGTYGFQS